MCPVLTESAPPVSADELRSDISFEATDDLRLCHSFARTTAHILLRLAHGSAGARGRCGRGQRWPGGRPRLPSRPLAGPSAANQISGQETGSRSRIPTTATPKTPKPLVSCVSPVSGIAGRAVAVAAAWAVVVAGAGVLAGDAGRLDCWRFSGLWRAGWSDRRLRGCRRGSTQ